MTRTLSIEAEFTRYPGPRYRKDGPYSGEEFREVLLEPRLKQAIYSHEKLEVILDKVSGYGSSFLEEAFGGLVRCGFTKKQITENLEIVADTPRFTHHKLRALSYIDDALKRK
ncbi:STAS-like domain-containing protein [Methylobacterium sp. WL120]|uniref:STAS-like domain-containing protein n=1 Tax=Methylobacterium sp. WL120 TaxID=2603887 RepID=UPI0011C83D56|nr:STAS-like domain-containing protein [Methylobacterium sp. WL120]TXM65790.1 DUF4325 domain-containing protein [Methylobacterium sp. WL120]